MTEPVRRTPDTHYAPVTSPPTAPPQAPEEPQENKTAGALALEQMGGVFGAVISALPVLAFVFANSAYGLKAATGVGVGFVVAGAVALLVRKEPVKPALSGLLGVAIVSLITWKTGSAKGYFLIGIWSNLVLGAIFLISVIVRRPLAGLVWGAFNGTRTTWLEDKPSRRYYTIATLSLVTVFLARFAVQQWLYDGDHTGWLAVTRLLMGYPLLALALLVVVWAGRRSGKRLKALAAQQPAATAPAPHGRPATAHPSHHAQGHGRPSTPRDPRCTF
ncbi:DUF3159 domain-containing protein [Streptomyces sp. NPDC050560]|uniref:DUF3159 domain-containing protein n=1 Tax=Streptomyces sp. NPDC050560 TaxID=3365630 RepID=UPI00379BF256